MRRRVKFFSHCYENRDYTFLVAAYRDVVLLDFIRFNRIFLRGISILHESVSLIQGPCAACMLARVEQERLDSLKYDRATIYIKCIDDNEESKSETDSEVTYNKYLRSV